MVQAAKDAKPSWKDVNILKKGEILAENYMIDKKISQGGFGQVYEIKLVNDDFLSMADTNFEAKYNSIKELNLRAGSKLAVKIESTQLGVSVLKLEYEFLNKLRLSNFFMKCFEYGECPTFKYLIQTLGGSDLSNLQRKRPDRCFTMESTLRLLVDMLGALNYLHDSGIVHRDVKPSNFVLSPFNDTRVCLVDFGIAFRSNNADGSLIDPRSLNSKRFKGTYVYSSINAQETCVCWKSDDLISLHYSILTMSNYEILPWRKFKDKDDILDCKKKTNMQDIHQKFPIEVQEFLDFFYTYATSLKYGNEPSFKMIFELLESILEEWDVNDSDPFEWESSYINEEKENYYDDDDMLVENLPPKTRTIGDHDKIHSRDKYHDHHKQHHVSTGLSEGDVHRYDENTDDDENMKQKNRSKDSNWLNRMINSRFFCVKGFA